MLIKNQIEKLPLSWQSHFNSEYQKPYFYTLQDFLTRESMLYTIYPPIDLWFHAFVKTDFNDISVVILGQDPYHNTGQANGLCFSVNDAIDIPPSCKNIFSEIHNDTGGVFPETGNLERWSIQGVLLMNSILTVRASQAGSHQKQGWEIFTDSIIQKISEQKHHVVFLLWGNYAIKKAHLIDSTKHLILTSPHPSPLSAYRGFFGNKHFSKTNEYLIRKNKKIIQW